MRRCVSCAGELIVRAGEPALCRPVRVAKVRVKCWGIIFEGVFLVFSPCAEFFYAEKRQRERWCCLRCDL